MRRAIAQKHDLRTNEVLVSGRKKRLLASMSIEGQSVVIIGGSSGIGLAIAKDAVDSGAEVIIAGRSQAKLYTAKQEIAGDVVTHMVDVSDEESLKRLFSTVGVFDHLVVTASSVKTGPVRELSLPDARASMDSKFWGQYMTARLAQIAPGGSVTLFSGTLSRRPAAGQAVLAAANAAVEALGRALAIEFAPIRVNVVSPGLTDTPAYAGIPENSRIGMYAAAAKRSLVGRVGKPEDIASVALALMDNSLITGVVVDVDGGGLLSP